MSDPTWLVIPVNPEPWAVGPVSTGRANGKMFGTIGRNAQLHAYQEAVREYLEELWTGDVIDGPAEVEFFFWRHLATYRTPSGRTKTKNEVDVTNLIKGTEDALQGIVIKNDKNNVSVRGHMMDQGPNVTGCVVIKIAEVDVQELRVQVLCTIPQNERFAVMKMFVDDQPY